MICNICGTKEATIHLTEILNGQMAEVHICEQCAEEKGTDFKTYFNFGDLLTGLTGMEKLLETPDKKTVLICKNCGMSYEDFSKNGRLGCSTCYESFKKPLSVVIQTSPAFRLPCREKTIQDLERHAEHTRPEAASGTTS